MKVTPEMVIKHTFSKTRYVFHKALTNLKSLVSHKPPRFFPFNNDGGIKIQKLEEFCMRNASTPPPGEAKREEVVMDMSSGKLMRSKRSSGLESSRYLAMRMKELEMMELGDVDHVLDVEEALHYYSRLTCPAYQHIVDKFFMDMYMEFRREDDAASASMRRMTSDGHPSMRRIRSDGGSLHSSMRRIHV